MQSQDVMVIQAGASWCGPCRTLKPLMVAKAADYEDSVKYIYMDVDKFNEIAQML